jgi:hypothetical protein
MRTIRFRLTGTQNAVDATLARLRDIDDVDRVEEVADQMHARDDSSSLGLPDDSAFVAGTAKGTDFHDIEAHATNAAAGEKLRGRAAIASRDLGVAVEFVDEF